MLIKRIVRTNIIYCVSPINTSSIVFPSPFGVNYEYLIQVLEVVYLDSLVGVLFYNLLVVYRLL